MQVVFRGLYTNKNLHLERCWENMNDIENLF